MSKSIVTIGKYSKLIFCFFVLTIPLLVHGQESEASQLSTWVALDAPTGHERLATDSLQIQFAGWQRDRYGNLLKTIGSGAPHRVVACGIDSYAFAVSQITDQGYLRLHRIGSGSRHPLWDQAHEGQQLRILTRAGPLVGVTAIANGHFASQHRDDTAIVSQDDLWLDVGASSATEVAEMGIQLLDPVLRHIPAWWFDDEIAGPLAGSRMGCAAVTAAAEAGINGTTGSTSYVLSVQHVFGWIGLGASLNWLPSVDELIVLGPGEAVFRNDRVMELGARVDTVLSQKLKNGFRLIAPRVDSAGALMERLDTTTAGELLAAVVDAINPYASVPAWRSAPAQTEVLNNNPSRWGQVQNVQQLREIEAQLDQVTELSAVPGHEGPVRDVIYNALPAWARELAQVDDMGNMWVEFGPVGEPVVFLAHMDEVGYEVAGVQANGVVNLTRLGGVVTPAWEGQPALLQLDPYIDSKSQSQAPQLRGVFLSRDDPAQKQPDSVQAWFGMDAVELADAGVEAGMGVTGYKEGHHLGSYRYTARSLDDRVGTTALLKALQQIDPESLQRSVIFAWSVREEGGLRGAQALARRFGSKARRAYSIDTFVSSDTPLESPHFAYAPLGSGPVLRSIENAAMAIPYELDRNLAIADKAGIEVQVGLTQGSTDGTQFTIYGAPNGGLSWPGRYSHSPAELADLRDIANLIDLIQAMAEAPEDL